MPEKVELTINNVRIGHFLSYRIDADLYTPADAFRLELANPETAVKAGQRCELRINGDLELTGIVDKVTRHVDRKQSSIVLEGRDLMGLLLDFHCEQGKTVEGMKLKALAEMLLKNVPFINRSAIQYQANVVGKIKGKKPKADDLSLCDVLDTAQRIGQIEQGMTVFEVLKNYALSRGMLFYCLPDGTLVFGRPLTSGAAEYYLRLVKEGTGNNIIESDVVTDISRRYSKVLVIGQQQGHDDISPEKINTTGSATDPDFPFYKPYVVKECNDNVSPAMRARLIMEKQRREGLQYTFTVGRHNQGGRNWRINAMCYVKDETQGLDRNYLIYGRTYEMNKMTGPITRLRLGEPGLVA